MVRFDLLDEYTCVVVPKRPQREASDEVAHREMTSDGDYGESHWRHAVAMIVGLGAVLTYLPGFISREGRQQRQVHRF